MLRLFLAMLVFGLVAVLAQVSLAQDGFQGPAEVNPGGGFTGPGIGADTVEQAIRHKTDSHVVLRGQIVRSLGKHLYLFKDATGEITLDIDDYKWNGLNVTPNDTVEIRGYLHTFMSNRRGIVDVKYISKVN
ncbi:MAG: NirD/YgiW/YdeI family stress tolerance protein [Deltaproteobacteria bacterium]|jgi:uncharacterized protein (TIGR00156 family)|nr:NirD/YgiW/YdeI family stress tolerance protein [Deltaproteobacteria bacterium]